METDLVGSCLVEERAKRENAPDLWNKYWLQEGEDSWRKEALRQVYHLIERNITKESLVIDLGGGVGFLAEHLREFKSANVTVVDASSFAVETSKEKGFFGLVADLETDLDLIRDIAEESDFVCSTETLEHLSSSGRNKLLELLSKLDLDGYFFSVPNDRLGPDEEPQHTVKFTAISFKSLLSSHFKDVYVEVLGPFLVGVCGPVAKKGYRLSVTLPVRDEAGNLAATIGSFRGVADEIVVGVDPRTTDDTFAIAQKYADVVFYLENPEGVGEEYQGEGKVHFSHCRNQCLERCSGDWIFMTEGHERLFAGRDVLMKLDKVVPDAALIGFVFREGGGQRWAFPWLTRRSANFRYARAVHNTLEYPTGTYCVQLPQIRTLHERTDQNAVSRAKQRQAQNRRHLTEDWVVNNNIGSLFYLAQEWRGFDAKRAMDRYQEFISKSNNGVQKYQARLVFALELMKKSAEKTPESKALREKAREILMGATADDWSRTEHWIWLGDLAYLDNALEQAYCFYNYASTRLNDPPFTVWWIDLAAYTYLPAQRMATVCAEMGKLEEALAWSEKALELLPDDAPEEVVREARDVVDIIRNAIPKKEKETENV